MLCTQELDLYNISIIKKTFKPITCKSLGAKQKARKGNKLKKEDKVKTYKIVRHHLSSRPVR